jgi:hypothetical protein
MTDKGVLDAEVETEIARVLWELLEALRVLMCRVLV